MEIMFKSLPLPKDEEIRKDVLEKIKTLPPVSIFRLLAIVPECFFPWIDLVQGIYQGNLNPKLREILICRHAYKANAPYELHQHRFVAKNHGVTDAELNIILSENPVIHLSDEENFICKVVDELETTATLLQDTFDELYTRYDIKTATEILITISHYACVSRFVNATRVQPEKTPPLANASSPLN